ncbi:hypothetical protein BC01_193 [Bacillus phage BC01]|nr:hypothetical protein BC01_193 [Bacillus phage BC01]
MAKKFLTVNFVHFMVVLLLTRCVYSSVSSLYHLTYFMSTQKGGIIGIPPKFSDYFLIASFSMSRARSTISGAYSFA